MDTNKRIKEWCEGHNLYYEPVLVKKLREVLKDDNKVADVLEVIDSVCRFCYDTDISKDGCWCMADD